MFLPIIFFLGLNYNFFRPDYQITFRPVNSFLDPFLFFFSYPENEVTMVSTWFTVCFFESCALHIKAISKVTNFAKRFLPFGLRIVLCSSVLCIFLTVHFTNSTYFMLYTIEKTSQGNFWIILLQQIPTSKLCNIFQITWITNLGG